MGYPTPWFQSNFEVPPSGDVTGATDYAAILAAANTLAAAGGGTIQLVAAQYYIGGNTLPLSNGVYYKGAGHSFSQQFVTNNPVFGGTVINGNGTTAAFAGNTAQGTVGTGYVNFIAGMLSGVGIERLTVKNFTYGVQCGGLYAPGAMFSEIKDVCAVNCQIGFWLENWIESNLEGLYAYNYSQQGIVYAGSGAGSLNNGNTTIRKWFAYQGPASSITTRNIVIKAYNPSGTGGGSYINDLTGHNVQANGWVQYSSTQACTCTASSANITVTDGTKFAVDMPVTFSASVNGFVGGDIYFITSVVGNVIQVSSNKGGSSIVLSGTTAVNIFTSGFESVEIYASANTSNAIQASTILGLDLEATGTCNLTLQGHSGGYYQVGFIADGNSAFQAKVGISSALKLVFSTSGGAGYPLVNIDNNSGGLVFVEGAIGSFKPNDVYNGRGIGIGLKWLTQAGQLAAQYSGILDLQGNFNHDIFINSVTSGLHINNAMHWNPVSLASGATILPGQTTQQNASYYYYSWAGAGTTALPAITANMAGLVVIINNPSASTFTVSTSSSQNIVGLGASVTSIAMATLTTIQLIATNNGGTLYWARVS